ncbi:MAG: hypothetical protein JRJ20_18075 [Deltaproteobacteria bacterium]|nr:hypothetical protein [Deltaproteobacteria bacterium]
MADEVGAALLRATGRGVTCRVLHDAIGSANFLKSRLLEQLKAGGIKNAVLAIFMPALISGITLFVLVEFLMTLPLIGVVAGMGGSVLSLLHIVPLLLGAIIGAKVQGD